MSDGSPEADAALRFAHQEAGLRGADLDVIHAWIHPYAGRRTNVTEPRDVEELDAATVLAATVKETLGTAGDTVPIHARLVEGAPAQALLEASVGADLLVVGHRGKGGFLGLRMGSVSTQVAQHAPCPVVVVR